ncbi:Subtilase family protein [Paraburkholderia ribeironis]|uniref:Subtilase family protein n=1 Tax=Paraburkholderia ribeironis TaxID=1247936 RepID=A0A1N7S6N1_9BURK|nr:S8/S53 family peptidase [Paraburkholderia ribeironis]SIT42989.1 Subtilase family protein [Paraburkholderia ribeironis]
MLANNADKLLIRLPESYVNALRNRTVHSTARFAGIGPGALDVLFPAPTSRFVGESTDWLVLRPDAVEDMHPWDRAHKQAQAILRAERNIRRNDVYVEPNIAYRQPSNDRNADKDSHSAVEPTTGTTEQGPPYPPSETLNASYPPASNTQFSPAWHLEHARFPQAWEVTQGDGVRIAHLDIGWWPEHYSVPLNMRAQQGWNFVEDNDNTSDPGEGPNAGHGTATLALLAGNEVSLTAKTPATPAGQVYEGFIGGAPRAEVVPVRIAGVDGSVVHLYGETMAKGLMYALKPGNSQQCDVVSLSHGGLPMKSWARATNALFEAGVVVVAAAGDSFWAVVTDIVTHFTLYPSAFYRVVTATGVTFDEGPYKRDELGVMQGCWGPDKVMLKATGAYTPNVPSMTYRTEHGWTMHGGGTSSSAPQIAAACALWLAGPGKAYPKDWRRVIACRETLRLSVQDRKEDFSTIGLGRLDAAAMLDENLARDIKARYDANELRKIRPDDVSWPLFRLLAGLPPVGDGSKDIAGSEELFDGSEPDTSSETSGIEQMYEVEALQVFYRSRNKSLIDAVQSFQDGHAPSKKQLADLKTMLLAEDNMSNALREYLSTRPCGWRDTLMYRRIVLYHQRMHDCEQCL